MVDKFARHMLQLHYVCMYMYALFLINGLSCKIEKCLGLGVEFSKSTMSSLLFADDFIAIAKTE